MFPRNEGYPISIQCRKCHVVMTTEVTYIPNPSCGLILKILTCFLLWLTVFGWLFAGLFNFLYRKSKEMGYIYPRFTIFLFLTLGVTGFVMAKCCKGFLVVKQYWGLHACTECGVYLGSKLEDFTPPKRPRGNEGVVINQV